MAIRSPSAPHSTAPDALANLTTSWRRSLSPRRISPPDDRDVQHVGGATLGLPRQLGHGHLRDGIYPGARRGVHRRPLDPQGAGDRPSPYDHVPFWNADWKDLLEA